VFASVVATNREAAASLAEKWSVECGDDDVAYRTQTLDLPDGDVTLMAEACEST
nr:hypothetical protein [Acidimicrobiia bacterium]